MSPITFKDFLVGKKFDLGITAISEQEIIDFAKAFDPLEFHTNKAVAQKSIFKGIVASGPHIFTVVHRDKCIPLFGHTIICGLELNNWRFIKPVYPDQKISARTIILSIKPNPEKNYALVSWLYEFLDEKNELVQSLQMTISHKMS